jgi:hypothetical protein
MYWQASQRQVPTYYWETEQKITSSLRQLYEKKHYKIDDLPLWQCLNKLEQALHSLPPKTIFFEKKLGDTLDNLVKNFHPRLLIKLQGLEAKYIDNACTPIIIPKGYAVEKGKMRESLHQLLFTDAEPYQCLLIIEKIRQFSLLLLLEK